MRFALVFQANNRAKNAKVNGDHRGLSSTSKKFIILNTPQKISQAFQLCSFPFFLSTLRSKAQCYMAQATQKIHSYLRDLMILYQNSIFKSTSRLVLNSCVSLVQSSAKLNPFGRELASAQYSPVPLSTLGLTSGSDLGSTLMVTKFLETDLAFLGKPCAQGRQNH